MSIRNFFYQECAVCGRHLRIRVEHLGRELACSHCQGLFIARDPDLPLIRPLSRGDGTADDSLSFPGWHLGVQQPAHSSLPR